MLLDLILTLATECTSSVLRLHLTVTGKHVYVNIKRLE